MENQKLSIDVDYEYDEMIPIKKLIYLVRNQQVMMDSDLAVLYHVETKFLNRAVTRNISRFPERYRFQLTKEEYENLRCQFGTSSLKEENTDHVGRRYMPFALVLTYRDSFSVAMSRYTCRLKASSRRSLGNKLFHFGRDFS